MGFQFNPITGNLDLVGSGGGGNPFDQSLNTTDDVAFNSASFGGGNATIEADGSASFGINGSPFSIDDGGNFSGNGNGYIANFSCDSASVGGGSSTISSDGQFSFQSGAYYSSTDGTGNFLTLQNDNYYQLQFIPPSGGAYWNIGAYFPSGMFQIANSSAGFMFVCYDGTQNGGDVYVDMNAPLQLQGGRLTSDGTNLYWNGTQIA